MFLVCLSCAVLTISINLSQILSLSYNCILFPCFKIYVNAELFIWCPIIVFISILFNHTMKTSDISEPMNLRRIKDGRSSYPPCKQLHRVYHHQRLVYADASIRPFLSCHSILCLIYLVPIYRGVRPL